MTLGSGLRAGKVFPVPVSDLDEKYHRRLIAEGLNHTAACAFTPYTQLQTLEDPVSLTDAGVDLEFSISVTPFIPARAYLLLVLLLSNADASADLNLTLEIEENGDVVSTTTNLYLASTGTRGEQLVVQLLRDLEPNTTYTYTVTGTEGAAEDGIVVQGSSLSVRLEHRSLATEIT